MHCIHWENPGVFLVKIGSRLHDLTDIFSQKYLKLNNLLSLSDCLKNVLKIFVITRVSDFKWTIKNFAFNYTCE